MTGQLVTSLQLPDPALAGNRIRRRTAIFAAPLVPTWIAPPLPLPIPDRAGDVSETSFQLSVM